MQNVNKQLGNGFIIHMLLLQTYTGNSQGSNIFNRASIPVKMFINHLTTWLKPHRKKRPNHKSV
jgi:hypothetical protein